MAEVTHEQVPTNGIELHVAVAGPADGPPVVLCHGFPELWYSWRHQLGALADAGYRAYAPDLRGYGASSRPSDVADYGSDNLTGDLAGLLDHYGYDQATFVGHDWGAMVVWEMGRLHPDRVSSLCNMSVPYSNAPAPPTQIFEVIFEGKFFYMLYFQPVGPAEAEFEADPRLFLRTMLYSAGGEGMASGTALADLPREGTRFMDMLSPAPEKLPGWITEEDVDVYAAAFKESGFFGPVSFYRNMDANWERSKDIPPSVYTMPIGFITGSLDPVNTMMPGAIEAMAEAMPDFRGATVIDGAGHWVQQERPAETNAALLSFLSSRVSDLVALPPQPAGVDWPTEDWPAGRAPARRRPRPAARRGLRPRRSDGRDVRRPRGPRRAGRRRALPGRARALRPPPTPVTAETPLLSWSMAKSMLHAVVGLLVGDEKLDLDAPAAVPEWADPGDPRHAITLRQLLAMRDGLDFVEDYVDDRVSDVMQMLFGDGQSDMAHFAAARPLAAPPGTRFNYSSGTSNIISGVVARTVGPGESYARFLHGRLFGPARDDERRPRVRRGRHLGRLLLPAGQRARLRPLRAALPARRHVGRRPPAPGRAGWTTAAPWCRSTTRRTPAPTARTGTGVRGTRWRT